MRQSRRYMGQGRRWWTLRLAFLAALAVWATACGDPRAVDNGSSESDADAEADVWVQNDDALDAIGLDHQPDVSTLEPDSVPDEVGDDVTDVVNGADAPDTLDVADGGGLDTADLLDAPGDLPDADVHAAPDTVAPTDVETSGVPDSASDLDADVGIDAADVSTQQTDDAAALDADAGDAGSDVVDVNDVSAGTDAIAVCDPAACPTPSDACQIAICATNGVCGTASKVCSDGNACTVDACDLKTGCVFVPVPIGCNDGNACTLADACAGGVCVAGSATTCDDGEPCTDDSCDAALGCESLFNAATCTDGDACTAPDVCAKGTCNPGGVLSCDDGTACTIDSCSKVSGCVHQPIAGACDDGNLCTNGDACDGGTCTGNMINCDDGNPCTDDSCAPPGTCAHAANASSCSDGSNCTANDTCIAKACTSGPPVNCDDTNACTTDACDAASGCAHLPINGLCSDGDPCTVGEYCQSGKCVGGSLNSCDDAINCTVDSCDATGGCTHLAAAAACDDGKPCTFDTCQSTNGCTHGAISGPCDDGNACTSGDACSGGICTGATSKTCDDSNPCTVDSCDAATGTCSATSGNNGAACSDANPCTLSDLCSNGVCIGTAKVCAPIDSCHLVGTCDSASGLCLNPIATDGSPCSDGAACTRDDQCGVGVCAGTPYTCAAPDACHQPGVCAGNGTCTFSARVDGTACNDGVACTSSDACTAGVCVGTAYECLAPAACSQPGVCAGDATCTFAKATDGTGCSDGLLCTVNDSCTDGACSGVAKDCTDGSACTTDVCSAADGSCGHPTLSCDDGNSCTTDSCDPVNGCANLAANDGGACGVGGWCGGGLCILPNITVVAGGFHSCMLAGGGVQCWGKNDSGQLGDGTQTQRLTPVAVKGLGGTVVALAAGRCHTCALLATGAIECWGCNASGQLGDGDNADSSAPVQVAGIGSGATAIATTWDHTCAVVGGGVQCWGLNANAQLGDGTTAAKNAPVGAGTISNIVAIAAGQTHSCALDASGKVSCWGGNAYGQLGDNTTTQRPSPVAVSSLGATGGITAGGFHSCAIVGGAAKCWGYNATGQLGDNTTTNRWVPTAVNGLTSNVTGISAGSGHTCARTSTSAPVCWGVNTLGEVGDLTKTQRNVPTHVFGFGAAATSLSAGQFHSCAVVAGKYVRCWGDNASGGIGDGTTNLALQAIPVAGFAVPQRIPALQVAVAGNDQTPSNSHSCRLAADGTLSCWGEGGGVQVNGTPGSYAVPVQVATGIAEVAVGYEHTCVITTSGGVRCWGDYSSIGVSLSACAGGVCPPSDSVGLTADVVHIVSGTSHNCALLIDGSLRCWGQGYAGQLGYGSSGDSSPIAPITPIGMTSGVTAVIAGNSFTCAAAGGTLQCFGINSYGQLGDGTITQRLVPTPVVGFVGAPKLLTAGNNRTCATDANGKLWCWGYNLNGQLGDGTLADRHVPTAVQNGVGVTALATGVGDQTCALMQGVWNCWGSNGRGQLGDGTWTEGSKKIPNPVVGLGNDVMQTALGGAHTCAVHASGNVQCMGSNDSGQLGIGVFGLATRTTPVVATQTGVTGIALGQFFGCGIVQGSVTCWGANDYGELGAPNDSVNLVGAYPPGLPANLLDIGAGRSSAFAIDATGGLWAWGADYDSQLGDNATTQSVSTPKLVSGLPSGVVQATGGYGHTCALLASGGVWCWGLNTSGQVGNGTTVAQTHPVQVSGLTTGVTAISAKGNTSCAVVSGGAKCWGDNTSGQLGTGNTTNSSAPVAVVGLSSGVTAVETGGPNSCALLLNGTVQCWGDNSSGELGDGTTTQRLTPVAVKGLTGATAIAVGGYFACAIVSGGTVECWGDNSQGEVGNGTTTIVNTKPVPVTGITNAIAIRTGDWFACALLSDQSVQCWGSNNAGKLWDNTLFRTTPVYVVGFGG